MSIDIWRDLVRHGLQSLAVGGTVDLIGGSIACLARSYNADPTIFMNKPTQELAEMACDYLNWCSVIDAEPPAWWRAKGQ